jgi:signal transduction histidine kinase/ActR/RegA family two-component response regulator
MSDAGKVLNVAQHSRVFGERVTLTLNPVVAVAVTLLLLVVAGVLMSLVIRRLRRRTDQALTAQADTERRLRAAEQLRELSSALSRARTPADVVAACLPEFLHAVDAAAGAVYLISDDGTACELVQKVGYPELRVSSATRFPFDSDSSLNDAFRRRELVVVGVPVARRIDAAGASSETFPDLVEGDIVLPLVATGRAIGAVLLNLPQGRALDGDERDRLLSAGRHTAQALERARLYETAERGRAEAEALRAHADGALQELQKAEEALRLSEARYRTLAARTNRLYALNAGLSKAATLDAIASEIVRHGKVVAGAAAGSVALLLTEGTEFEVLYSEGHGTQPEAGRRLPAAAGLCATAAVKTKRPVLVGSFIEWQEKYPQSAAIAADGGYVSSASLPLLVDSSVLGVVTFHFTVPVNFDDEYTALLTSVAQHCAQALDRARMYEAAEHARTEAEHANRSKDDFLSTISHELRTPLNAMLGWAAMLRKGVVDPSRTQRAIEAIFNNATRQGRLIEELLDVSRIVAGRASIDLQNVDLGENIRGAVEAMMPLAAAKEIELRFDIRPGIYVTADPRRLEQIFLNLLSNAVKFTPCRGRIAVDLTVKDQSAEVRVSDTGAGIEQAFLPHVFERFRQADSATTRAVGGLGLGLFISRQLVEAQGGTLQAESAGPGTGATFIVTLPAVETTAMRWATEDRPQRLVTNEEAMPVLTGVSVLVVDDEPDALEVMAAALEACGASVVSASSARDALDVLEQSNVDLILSDIAMPGQDGCELIRTIRALPSLRLATIPAAAVTAHARDDERERALAAGFHMHLSKPVHPAALARAVATLALSRTA